MTSSLPHPLNHLLDLLLTEAEAGSDLGAVQMRAALIDGAWRLNGVKRFITNGNAEIQLILARVVAVSRRTRRERAYPPH